jgi:hypothetical protein
VCLWHLQNDWLSGNLIENAVHKVLPLPSVVSVRSVVSNALLDVNEMGTVLQLWMRANPDFALNLCVVLSVDAVAVRPMVAIDKDGKTGGLNQTNEIDADLFDTFVGRVHLNADRPLWQQRTGNKGVFAARVSGHTQWVTRDDSTQ